MKLSIIFLLFLAALSTGCSGKGKDKESGKNDENNTNRVPLVELDPNNIPADRQAEWDQYTKSVQAVMSDSMIGVYDATLMTDGAADNTYLVVDTISGSNNLRIVSYNFMLDDVDKESGCYRVSSGDMVNAKLNSSVDLNGLGSVLEWVPPYSDPEKKGFYRVMINETPLRWNFTKEQLLDTVSYGTISSQVKITVTNQTLSLVAPLSRTGSNKITAESIRANICSGEVIDEENIGSTNYSGLYDVTLVDSGKTYETYLHIDTTGKMLAYKFMADGFALDPKNCYSPSYLYNRSLHDRTLSYDATNKRFYTLVGTNTYYWNLDDMGNVVSVAKNSAASGSSVVSPDDEISIGITKETAFTLTDLQNNICQ